MGIRGSSKCVALASVVTVMSSASGIAGGPRFRCPRAPRADVPPAAAKTPGLGRLALTSDRRDTVVVRDDGIKALYALDGILLRSTTTQPS
jgi:hypothetical protein